MQRIYLGALIFLLGQTTIHRGYAADGPISASIFYDEKGKNFEGLQLDHLNSLFQQGNYKELMQALLALKNKNNLQIDVTELLGKSQDVEILSGILELNLPGAVLPVDFGKRVLLNIAGLLEGAFAEKLVAITWTSGAPDSSTLGNKAMRVISGFSKYQVEIFESEIVTHLIRDIQELLLKKISEAGPLSTQTIEFASNALVTLSMYNAPIVVALFQDALVKIQVERDLGRSKYILSAMAEILKTGQEHPGEYGRTMMDAMARAEVYDSLRKMEQSLINKQSEDSALKEIIYLAGDLAEQIQRMLNLGKFAAEYGDKTKEYLEEFIRNSGIQSDSSPIDISFLIQDTLATIPDAKKITAIDLHIIINTAGGKEMLEKFANFLIKEKSLEIKEAKKILLVLAAQNIQHNSPNSVMYERLLTGASQLGQAN